MLDRARRDRDVAHERRFGAAEVVEQRAALMPAERIEQCGLDRAARARHVLGRARERFGGVPEVFGWSTDQVRPSSLDRLERERLRFAADGRERSRLAEPDAAVVERERDEHILSKPLSAGGDAERLAELDVQWLGRKLDDRDHARRDGAYYADFEELRLAGQPRAGTPNPALLLFWAARSTWSCLACDRSAYC